MSLKDDITHLADTRRTNFAVQLLRLYSKSAGPNRARLASAFPNAAAVYEAWQAAPDDSPESVERYVPDLPYD